MGLLFDVQRREEWILRHRGERDRRVADRIKAVLWYDEGHTMVEIAYRLFLSDQGVRDQINDFIKSEKIKPENGGSVAQLSGENADKFWRIWTITPTPTCATSAPMRARCSM